ncbi:MAG: AzlD domain-containing protein [Actinomycetia bacterium]|nr:AzlD domain-containing protein [Actinomycetes bacterium]MCP4227796.1 AzlD domain-containing protein [Actinomycetes bacterium]MCP5030439.1 AzlD domain-containing protein [Actinomycetes bacterium]
MTPAATTLLLLAAGTYALKAAGPLVLGGDRSLPKIVQHLALLLPAALLAALVATSTFIDDQRWFVDARLAGLAAAAIALWQRMPFVVVVLAAAATTATVRALG